MYNKDSLKAISDFKKTKKRIQDFKASTLDFYSFKNLVEKSLLPVLAWEQGQPAGITRASFTPASRDGSRAMTET